MDKTFWLTIGGTILGSLVEEGIEEIFPGVGELEFKGEISGAISGLLSSQLTKDEVKKSIETFVRFAYKKINKKSVQENISDNDLKLFSKKFGKIPKKQKLEIINSFKNIAPYEYDFIIDFLNGLEET